MTDQIIRLEAELILESGLEPEKWIHRYARTYREIVDQLIREGQLLDKNFINLMIMAQVQDLFSKPE